MLHRAIWLLLASAALGCSGNDPNADGDTQDGDFLANQLTDCIADNPPSEPFDVGDLSGGSVAPMSGGAAPAPQAPTLQGFVDECLASDGSGCNGSFISLGAARCIATAQSLEPGLEPWTIGLTYHHSYHRIVWGVQNLLVNTASESSGKSLTLDAVDGRVLGRTGWRASE